MLPTEISRLVSLSREYRQELYDLNKIIKLNMKSLEICLQDSPVYLSLIQHLKHLVDEVDILAEYNQELEGEMLIMYQIQTYDLQVRQQRIQDYYAIIEEKRSLLVTKEDNVRRLTVPRINAASMGGENVSQTIESEVHQCTALKKNLSEELEKLTKLQKEVKVFRQHLSEVISRTKNAVVSSIDNYQRFINSPSKSLLILQRPKLMKLSKLYYDDIYFSVGTTNKAQLWFQERLAILRKYNMKLFTRLKEEVELTSFMSKDMEGLKLNYERARSGQRVSISKIEHPRAAENPEKKYGAYLPDEPCITKRKKRYMEDWETRRSI